MLFKKHKCTKCGKNKLEHCFIHKFRFNKQLLTKTCIKCRDTNGSRYIARKQNNREKIFNALKYENITRIDIYNIYQIQKRKCLCCNKRMLLHDLCIDRIDRTLPYLNNSVICCAICYVIRDDDINEFCQMLKDEQYPFDKVNKRTRKKRKIVCNRPVYNLLYT